MKRLGYAGIYFSKEADTEFTITIKNSEVWIKRKPDTAYKLESLYYDGVSGEEFELLEFKRDKKGKVTGFEISMSRAERIPFMKVSEKK